MNHWVPADSVNEMTAVKEGLTNETSEKLRGQTDYTVIIIINDNLKHLHLSK
jgi:hypothetical protein